MRLSALAEAVGEYLIHDTAATKVGGVKVLVKNRQLKQVLALENALACAAALDIAAPAVKHAGEVVVVNARVVGREHAGIRVGVAAFVLNDKLYEPLLEARAEHYQSKPLKPHFLWNAHVEHTRLTVPQRAEWVFVVSVKTVKQRR